MKSILVTSTLLLASTLSAAAEMNVTLNQVSESGVGSAVGAVRIVETPHGLVY